MKRTSGSAARLAMKRTSGIEQYCATSDTSDYFVLRSGESIPVQVRDVLRAARSEWVMMQRLPYEFVDSDQSSELIECIQKIISMPLVAMKE